MNRLFRYPQANKSARMQAFTSFFVPAALKKPTKEQHKHHRLGLAEHKIIETKPFRNCFVTTTLNNVVPCQISDKRAHKKYDAVAVFLQFNFGPQKAGSDKRIKAMKVEVNVVEPSGSTSEVCQVPCCTVCQPTVADMCCEQQKPNSALSSVLEIKGRYPIAARSKPEMVETTTHKGISASPEFQGINVGNAEMDSTKKYNIPNAMVMEAFPVGQASAVWQIYENDIYKSGVPATVNIAMVIQTDGSPFEISLNFSGRCPLFGALSLKANIAMQIKKGLLEVEKPEEFDADCGLDDTESDAFKEWIKTETQNHWAETVDYDS